MRFALISVLLVFGLFQFFHQVALAIAVQPGLVAVLAKFSGDVVPVQLEAGIDKEARKTAAYNAENKQYGGNPVLHAAKVKPYGLFTNRTFIKNWIMLFIVPYKSDMIFNAVICKIEGNGITRCDVSPINRYNIPVRVFKTK